MWFKTLVQGAKTKRAGYLSKLEETFSDPHRENAMQYWERLQGWSKITSWTHEKPRNTDEEEKEEIKAERARRTLPSQGGKTLVMQDEEEELIKRMPRVYTSKKPKIMASRRELYKLLLSHGFTNSLGRAEATWEFLELKDEQIVEYYAHLARGILDYFKCCDNFKDIKPYVDYHVRFSCLYTLSKKYNEHPQKTYKRFSKELLVPILDNENGDVIEKQCYPSSREIRKMIKGYSPKSWIDLYCPVK